MSGFFVLSQVGVIAQKMQKLTSGRCEMLEKICINDIIFL